MHQTADRHGRKIDREIRDLIRDCPLDTTIFRTVGIDGDWGAGKSSVLKYGRNRHARRQVLRRKVNYPDLKRLVRLQA